MSTSIDPARAEPAAGVAIGCNDIRCPGCNEPIPPGLCCGQCTLEAWWDEGAEADLGQFVNATLAHWRYPLMARPSCSCCGKETWFAHLCPTGLCNCSCTVHPSPPRQPDRTERPTTFKDDEGPGERTVKS